MVKRVLIAVGTAVLLLVPVWMLVVVPRFLWLPADFAYRAGVESFDNFYDEAAQDFKGEERTVTKFGYEVIGDTDNVLTVKNIFDVRTVLGEPVFAVEREYGVDRKTREHVAGTGDKNRTGYLMAPAGLKPGGEYTYWHINYDNPARMVFVGEEEIAGLPVFHYKSEGLTADQTDNLSFLPGVGDTRGVRLDVELETWVEPLTGYLVKYEDQTLANYYDLSSGETINPWNKFHNEYNEASIVRHARLAKAAKRNQLVRMYSGSLVGVIIGVSLMGAGWHRRRL